MTSVVSWRRFLLAPVLALLLVAAVACSGGSRFSPAGAQDPANSREVTVPDDISNLDSAEVERRLARLLNGGVTGGQAAPGVEPTAVPAGPTLEEILAALNSATPVPGSGKIVISISAETLSGLQDAVLTIKSPPSYGTATVIAPNQILYMPDGSGDGNDSFEYELLDGDRPVVSQVMEIRK